MRVTAGRPRVGRWAAAVAAVIPLAVGAAPAGASGPAPIGGSGSSWASVAIDISAQHVRRAGLVVNFNPDGSAAGRADFIAGQDDFAVSDVPFRDGHDKLGGTGREVVPWDYSYIPVPAGASRSPITSPSTAA